MKQGKILVVRGGAIGDFILTMPVFAALREQFPQASIEVLGYPQPAALAQAGGLVDGVRSIEARPLAGFFARGGALDEGLRDYFAGFAIIISYLFDPDEVFQQNVACCSKAQFIAGPHRPEERADIHATEVFLKPLERLAIFGADTTPQLAISPKAAASLGRFAVHPGSGSERKNWPEEKWAEALAQLLRNPVCKCLLIGGEAEGDRVERLASILPRERIKILQQAPLVTVAEQLAGCGLFMGHDSGISHLAAALGVPSIILWGESREAVWRPKGDHVQLIRPGEAGLPALPMERFLESVRAIKTKWSPGNEGNSRELV